MFLLQRQNCKNVYRGRKPVLTAAVLAKKLKEVTNEG